MLLFGFSMAIEAEQVYKILVVFLGVTLCISGIRSMVYYISMARHMVGGISILYRSVIVFDIGLFTLSIANIPLIFVVLYLAGIHGFSGFIDIMRAVEGKRMQAHCKLSLSQGIINIVIAILCLIFLKTTWVAMLFYGTGLMYSGVVRIIQAFRRTAVVYIQ